MGKSIINDVAADGGFIAKIRDGDIIGIDAAKGRLAVGAQGDDLASRPATEPDHTAAHAGMGCELFAAFRRNAARAGPGASIFPAPD